MPEQPWMDWMDGRCQDKKEKASLHRRQQQKMNIFFFFIKARSIDKWFDSCEILLLWFLLKRSIENEIRERQLVYFKCFDSSCSSSSGNIHQISKYKIGIRPLQEIYIKYQTVKFQNSNTLSIPAFWKSRQGTRFVNKVGKLRKDAEAEKILVENLRQSWQGWC